MGNTIDRRRWNHKKSHLLLALRTFLFPWMISSVCEKWLMELCRKIADGLLLSALSSRMKARRVGRNVIVEDFFVSKIQ